MWGWQVGQILGQACLLITEQEPPAKAESVVWHCSWEDMNIYLLTPDREPVTDQSMDTTKVHFVSHCVLLELLTRAEMTQNQLHHQKLTPARVTSHEIWNLECTAQP